MRFRRHPVPRSGSSLGSLGKFDGMETTDRPSTTPTGPATPKSPVESMRRVFRVVAFAEALSWLGLLIGMYFKYIPETSEIGVKIFGPIHGGIFVLYLLVTLRARSVFGWSLTTTFWAGVASIPPFATALFEVLADRRGLIGRPAVSRAG